MRLFRLLAFTLIFAWMATPAGSAAANPARPSFDCTSARDVIEQTICGDPKLEEADTVMAPLFAAAKISAFGEGPSSELTIQRKWLKEREACRQLNPRLYRSRVDCLLERYNERNQDLAIAALFAEPKLALDTLHKVDPKAAELYEAIFDYVTARGRSQIERLLEPYFKDFGELSYSPLSNNGIKKPADAVASEDNFIQFLQVASVSLETGSPARFPCAAIVRRPALLGAEDSFFGGAIDGSIFLSDCSETLPPLPKLDALVKAINDTWPHCEGTIRFQLYRTFYMDVDRARLGLGGARDSGEMPRPKGVAPRLIAAAINELSRYYATYQRGAPSPPRALAMQNVRVMLADGGECE